MPFKLVNKVDQSSQTITLNPNETVAQVKANIAAKEGIPVDQQRLIFSNAETKKEIELGLEEEVEETIQQILARQDIILTQQDEVLSQIANSVSRIKEISLNMNREIKEQNQILADLNHQLEDTNDRLAVDQGKIKKLDRKMNKKCLLF